MTRLVLLITLVTVGGYLFGATPTHSQDTPTPYVALYGGVTAPNYLTIPHGHSSQSDIHESTMRFSSGQMAGIKLGLTGPTSHPLARWFDVQLDASYAQFQLESEGVHSADLSQITAIRIHASKVQLATGALHLAIKYPDGMIQPYIGAGPALVHAKTSTISIEGLGNSLSTSTSSTTLGLSWIAGVRFLFSQRLGAFFEYKYIRSNFEFESLIAGTSIHGGVGGLHLVF